MNPQAQNCLRLLFTLVTTLGVICLAARAGQPQTAKTIVVPGQAARFDWMTVDPKRRRLLAGHTGAGTLEVLDLDSEKLVASVKTGEAQGVAFDNGSLYFVGDKREAKIILVDAEKLVITGEIKLPGGVDAIAFDGKHKLLYADHDDGNDCWVIDPYGQKIVATIALGGVPEYIQFDEKTDRLYQNIKSKDEVEVIDPDSFKVTGWWLTAPAKSPHGLAIDEERRLLFSAGRNNLLAVFDMWSGQLIAHPAIAGKVDQIACDMKKQRVYCACAGFVSVVKESKDGARLLGNVPTPPGAHTLAVDPQTHAVWISYCDKEHSYLQKLNL